MSDEPQKKPSLHLVSAVEKEHSLLPDELLESLESYEEKFDYLRTMVRGLIQRDTVNAIIISGPPGIGKTFTIDGILDEQSRNFERPITYNKKSGKITPLAFYDFLVANAGKNCISFFDDADSILTEPTSLALLKQASELRKQRIISYESTKLDITQVPYNGKLVIATNVQYSSNPHYEAIIDRFHCYDMRVSYQEKLAKLFDIVEKDTEDQEVSKEVLLFLLKKQKEIEPSKLTLRTFAKLKELAQLMPRSGPRNWQRFVEISGTYMKFLGKD